MASLWEDMTMSAIALMEDVAMTQAQDQSFFSY